MIKRAKNENSGKKNKLNFDKAIALFLKPKKGRFYLNIYCKKLSKIERKGRQSISLCFILWS